LAPARLRKNSIFYDYVYVHATLQLSHRGVLGVLGLGGVANGGAPESFRVHSFPLHECLQGTNNWRFGPQEKVARPWRTRTSPARA
jgi:hypothetical protein